MQKGTSNSVCSAWQAPSAHSIRPLPDATDRTHGSGGAFCSVRIGRRDQPKRVDVAYGSNNEQLAVPSARSDCASLSLSSVCQTLLRCTDAQRSHRREHELSPALTDARLSRSNCRLMSSWSEVPRPIWSEVMCSTTASCPFADEIAASPPSPRGGAAWSSSS